MNDARKKLLTQVMKSKEPASKAPVRGNAETVFNRYQTPGIGRGKSARILGTKIEGQRRQVNGSGVTVEENRKREPVITYDSLIPDPQMAAEFKQALRGIKTEPKMRKVPAPVSAKERKPFGDKYIVHNPNLKDK